MKAMLLAAGRGERMRPLTDHCPKPLLQAGGRSLIGWHLQKLAAAGFTEVVVNHAWLGEQIEAALGDGTAFGLSIRHSAEAEALETAGGIAQALTLLTEGEADNAPFAVISSDVWSDADYSQLHAVAARLADGEADCWCLMVDNPGHHQRGDFVLADGLLQLAPAAAEAAAARDITAAAGGEPLAGDAPTASTGTPADAGADAGSAAAGPLDAALPGDTTTMATPPVQTLTYSGIGVYTPAMFCHIAAGTRSPLRPWLELAIDAGRARGDYHRGTWFDIGTPARLAALEAHLASLR